MAGSSNQYVYQVGVTQIVVGASLATQVLPPRCTTDVTLKLFSGTSLALVNGATTQVGYPLGSTEVVKFLGPATFFLSAAGTTQIASVLWGFSSGYSLTP